jgi:DNA-binding NarL/FixJ family response regulator
MVIGDSELLKIAGGTAAETAPDVVVVSVGAADNLAARMHEARGRAPGAALVVVDGASTPERLAAALYGGARAYLERMLLPQLGRVVACTAVRRRGEVTGRRMVETLARFSVLDEQDQQRPPRPAIWTRASSPTPPPAAASSCPRARGAGGRRRGGGADGAARGPAPGRLPGHHRGLGRGGDRPHAQAALRSGADRQEPSRRLGLEVLRVARTLDPAPAVVLITGYSSYDSAVEALDIGAQDYIEKPIRDVEQLRFRIRRALSARDEQMSRGAAASTGGTGPGAGGGGGGDAPPAHRRVPGPSSTSPPPPTVTRRWRLLQTERDDVVPGRPEPLPGKSGLRVIEQARASCPTVPPFLHRLPLRTTRSRTPSSWASTPTWSSLARILQKLAEKVAGGVQSRCWHLAGLTSVGPQDESH